MNVIQSGARDQYAVTETESSEAGVPPNMRFLEHHPRHSPSLACTLGQVVVQSLIAVLLILTSTVLWTATFGGFSAGVEPPSHCPRHDVGPSAASFLGGPKP